MSQIITRRALVGGLFAGSGALLSGCDRLSNSQGFVDKLRIAETLNLNFHRLLQPREGLAREFSAEDMSPIFRANGTRRPVGLAYDAHVASNFADWRLKVEGPGFTTDVTQPCPDQDNANADPDHPARLCRGVERNWEMAWRAAKAAA